MFFKVICKETSVHHSRGVFDITAETAKPAR